MKTYQNLKKGTKAGLIISMVLLVLALVNSAFVVSQALIDGRIRQVVMSMIDVVICVFVLLYAFFGYKKPHGNMLRFTFFAFAINLALQGTVEIAGMNHYVAGDLLILAGLTIAYVAGGLNKIEKNKFILIFAGFLIVARVIITFLTTQMPIGVLVALILLTQSITLAALSFAYIARYEEHKAAGLEDVN